MFFVPHAGKFSYLLLVIYNICFHVFFFFFSVVASLIKVLLFWQPFWRLWNAAGSDGRGVIGIVSALRILDEYNINQLN